VVTFDRDAPSLPDPDDEPIVAAALSGKSDVFVTGDKALLELQCIEGMPIIAPRQLWEKLACMD
jgi:predicted nucleic acid-binding protein